ncbi:hypothetical protein EVAR_630_1 [Eumeta japonica]|uniref:Uncharacterized protein n=1 Tax=Eumeta variegata TaxID=151549 RepID=A0A4C1SDF9_EUMVA|nr:hypothetical protein EVAR_630_1 [Eumeta japonica]
MGVPSSFESSIVDSDPNSSEDQITRAFNLDLYEGSADEAEETQWSSKDLSSSKRPSTAKEMFGRLLSRRQQRVFNQNVSVSLRDIAPSIRSDRRIASPHCKIRKKSSSETANTIPTLGKDKSLVGKHASLGVESDSDSIPEFQRQRTGAVRVTVSCD